MVSAIGKTYSHVRWSIFRCQSSICNALMSRQRSQGPRAWNQTWSRRFLVTNWKISACVLRDWQIFPPRTLVDISSSIQYLQRSIVKAAIPRRGTRHNLIAFWSQIGQFQLVASAICKPFPHVLWSIFRPQINICDTLMSKWWSHSVEPNIISSFFLS